MEARTLQPVAHPVLDVAAARACEDRLFAGDERSEWTAMSQAGQSLASAVLADWVEQGPWPSCARILILAGKGHNAGDALIAARELLRQHPAATADVLLLFPAMRPLAQRALRELHSAGGERVRMLRALTTDPYQVCLDGIFGFQFRPPLPPSVAAVIEQVNTMSVGMRVAVDLPSGLGGGGSVFRADFTYATGSVKAPTLEVCHQVHVGRLRYLDLGFFEKEAAHHEQPGVLVDRTLGPLAAWRPAQSDKRHYGHLFVVGGSRSYPGAVMMTIQAALRSGVGLLTAFVPESLAPSFAAHVPEAMWVGCPETLEGGLALEALHLVRQRQDRATVLVAGPGMTRERESLAFAREVVALLRVPTVLDADALQGDIVSATTSARILTPHAGEYARLAGTQELKAYARAAGAVTVLKGVPTRVSDGHSEVYSLAGGPVLARGGSGDILAGMIGGVLAQFPENSFGAACAGVLWHGRAADSLARAKGSVPTRTTELLDHLADVLRAVPR